MSPVPGATSASVAAAYAERRPGGSPLRLTRLGLWHATPPEVAVAACDRLARRGVCGVGLALDAGMGDGRLLAALALSDVSPDRALGIECDPALFAVALRQLDRLGLLERPGLRAVLGDYEQDACYAGAGARLSDVELVLSYPDGNEARLAHVVAERCAPRAILALLSPDVPGPAPGLRRLWTEAVPAGAAEIRWRLSAYGR